MEKLNGTAHTVIGGAAGFLTASLLQTNPTETIILVGIGALSGLMPDADTDGKLSNKITFSHKLIKSIVRLFSFFLIGLSYFFVSGWIKWIGIGMGIILMILSSFITQRRMLTITGIGTLIAGIFLKENWIWLFGLFLILASFVPHRSYTHSLVGVLFFGIIASHLEAALKQEGIFMACILGYISHLIADMKLLPFNKRGIKLFLPFSKKEL